MFETLPILFRRIPYKNQLNCLVYNLNGNHLLKSCLIKTTIPRRSTMVVKRIFPVQLHKECNNPCLRGRNFYYELEENTDLRPEPIIDVVLTSYVQGVGNPGDIVSMKRIAAYEKLLVPGLATYLTEESFEYNKKMKADSKLQEARYTPTVERTIQFLKNRTISVVMNKDVEWTIEPWHIRASFRKAGVHIMSEDSIKLPPKPIKGPDLNLQDKTFYVTLTINKLHKIKVLCRIHHWTAIVSERLPYKQDFWKETAGKVFPEDEEDNTKVVNTPETNSPSES